MIEKRAPSTVKMHFFRSKTMFPLIALLSIGVFLWCMKRYDQTAFLHFKPPQLPIDRLNLNTEQFQVDLSQGQGQGPGPGKAQEQRLGSQGQGQGQEPGQEPGQGQGQGQDQQSSTCEVDPRLAAPLPFSEWLPRKNFTRAYLRPRLVSSDTEFRSVEEIEKPVLPPMVTMERGMIVSQENREENFACPEIVDVDVSADDDVEETSKLLFGLASTVDRLDRLLPSLLYSYGNTKAGLIVLVPESDDDLEKQETYFRNRGLDLTLKASPLEFTDRYFGMVEAFSNHISKHRPHTTWVGFSDDDTFFLSLPTVAKELKLFDERKKHYIGSLSEANWQVDKFGHIAFGGAGVFVSKPLLDVLMKHYDECQSWGEQPGDQKLGQCIQHFGDCPLTLWPSLFQMDISDPVDGVYESGRKIDTMHHWNSWYTKDVVKMATVAAAAGRKSVLRRWVFDQEEIVNNATGQSTRQFWVLTNGYSLVRYTYDHTVPDDAIDFDAIEKTWPEDPVGFEERLGPLRPVEVEGVTKDRWLLEDASVVGDNVHQFYVREEDDGHSVIEIIWLGPKGGGGGGISDHPIRGTYQQ